MAEVLTQEEIDRLLTSISAKDSSMDFRPASSFESIEAFEDLLTKRKYPPENLYGMFDKDISVCRFFDSGNNEGILADIKRKNEEQGYDNIKIPNSNILLLNYSFCGKCKTIYSLKEITEYYMNPKPGMRYRSRAWQYREDTRVYCYNCDTYFFPSLVISDGTPKNEVQFLCRSQTIEAVEKYFLKKNIRVLTKKKKTSFKTTA